MSHFAVQSSPTGVGSFEVADSEASEVEEDDESEA